VWYKPWFNLFGHPWPNTGSLREHAAWADIIHTTTYSAALPSRKAARRYNKPCLLSVHEVLGKRWFQIESNPLVAALFWSFENFILLHQFSHYHCDSQATKHDALRAGLPADKCSVVYFGIEHRLQAQPTDESPSLAEYFGVPATSKIFFFFGRAGKTKGVPQLLDAIERVREELPDEVRFALLLGDHPLGAREDVIRQTRERGLDNLIGVRESVSDALLHRFLTQAYCVVIPSLTEGFGFSAAEACAIGVPVIASDAGSLPEVVSGRHLFFRKGDAHDLADKLKKAWHGDFLSSPSHEFSWEKTTSEMLELYARLVQTAGVK